MNSHHEASTALCKQALYQIELKNPPSSLPTSSPKLLSSLDIPLLPILILEKFSEFVRKCCLELWRITLSLKCVYLKSHVYVGGCYILTGYWIHLILC